MQKPSFWAVALRLVLLGFFIWVVFINPNHEGPKTIRYDQMVQAIQENRVIQATFSSDEQELTVTSTDQQRLTAAIGLQAPHMREMLERNKVALEFRKASEEEGFFAILQLILSLLLPFMLIFALISLFRASIRASGGAQSPFTFGRSKAKLVENSAVTFADVAGADEAKQELQEVVSFLKDQTPFIRVGARIPRGVLLVGPPGTGKTLLARAIAGEAKVPFFSLSGSEFVEMFVGVGASRVRDLFRQAREKAPCIVFVDEIDALGAQRSLGTFGGNDEREQTLNQLLAELDGFQGDTGVILMAATNRPDVLDAALLRPGRFDRQIIVDLPDLRGREAILAVHSRGKPLAPDVSLRKIAQRTTRFSGADLANLLNEAAIIAARKGQIEITAADISAAIDRVIAGPEKRSMVVSSEMKRLVAYHEAGHALIGLLSPGFEPVQKVSIIPRGMAGGLTWFAPDEEQGDSGLRSKDYFLKEIRVSLGGRAAEELLLGPNCFTNGASNDLQRVTSVVDQMLTQWGMGTTLGHRALPQSTGGMFLGRRSGFSDSPRSEALAARIEDEATRLVQDAYDETKRLLETYRAALVELAALLIEKETVERDELLALVQQHGIE